MTARALRVQPGGRPCGAGPVTWPAAAVRQGASRGRARDHAYHRATLAPRHATICDQDGALAGRPSACVWGNNVGPIGGPLRARETTPRRPCRACSRRLAKSNSRNSRACNLGGPCVARQLRPRDWAGPAGPPLWLHAQRACAHFEPSEPLWVQLLQKPRACQYKRVCMGFANVQVSFKKLSPLQNLLSSSAEGPMQLIFGHNIGPSALLESRF